jgi:hypothetical protein
MNISLALLLLAIALLAAMITYLGRRETKRNPQWICEGWKLPNKDAD